jgi:predicted metal-dependent phosphoesterase TrpH
VHSHWSDGAQSPERIVRAAAGRLDVVALTDHDEIRGAVRARDFVADHPELGVDVVVGEEISTLNGYLIASLPAAHGHGDRAVNPTSIDRRPR